LCPSFQTIKRLTMSLDKNVNWFIHEQGTTIANLTKEFKKSKNGVLISPSIFEGMDFAGDDSRWQIICKTPYPSLGDIRIKKIADQYGSIYREIALYKILQGIGRSIRSADDSAITYFLDKSSETIFKSSLNIWKERFSILS